MSYLLRSSLFILSSSLCLCCSGSYREQTTWTAEGDFGTKSVSKSKRRAVAWQSVTAPRRPFIDPHPLQETSSSLTAGSDSQNTLVHKHARAQQGSAHWCCGRGDFLHTPASLFSPIYCTSMMPIQSNPGNKATKSPKLLCCALCSWGSAVRRLAPSVAQRVSYFNHQRAPRRCHHVQLERDLDKQHTLRTSVSRCEFSEKSPASCFQDLHVESARKKTDDFSLTRILLRVRHRSRLVSVSSPDSISDSHDSKTTSRACWS